MKSFLISALLAAGTWAGLSWGECCEPRAPRGEYLEARTATVFGGACHINSERLSQGRDALLAWSIEAGAWDGVDLAGTHLVAALSSPVNLAEAGERSVRVWISAQDAAARAAGEAWLRATEGALLGDFPAAQATSVCYGGPGKGFSMTIEGVGRLAGVTLADRACCSMPEQRWYEPLAAGAGEALVGNATSCRFFGADGLQPWTYEGANNVLVASF